MRCRCIESSTLHWQGDRKSSGGELCPPSEQMWAPKDIVHVGAVLGFGAEPGDVKLAQLSLLW